MTVFAQQQPRTIADLLAMSQNASAPPVDTPQASMAPEIATQGSLTSQQRQSLIDAMLAPEPVGPAPVAEEYSAGKGVGLSLVDALNNIASIYGGVNLRSNAYNDYRNRIERQRAEQNAYGQRNAEAQARAKIRKSEFLLSEDAAAKQDKLAASVRLAEQEAAQRKLKEGRQYAEGVAALERQQHLQDVAAQDAKQLRAQQRAEAHDVAMAKLHDKLKTEKPDPTVKEQLKLLGEAKAGINEIAGNLQGALEKFGGPLGVRTFVRRKVAELNLEPDTEKAVWAYYDNEIQQQLDDAGPNPGRGF